MGVSLRSKLYVGSHSSAIERSFFVWFAPLKKRCALPNERAGMAQKLECFDSYGSSTEEKSSYLPQKSCLLSLACFHKHGFKQN